MSSSEDDGMDEYIELLNEAKEKKKGKKPQVKKRKSDEEHNSDDDKSHYVRRSKRKRTNAANKDVKNEEDSDRDVDVSDSDEDPPYVPEKKSDKKDNITSDDIKPFKSKTKLKVAKTSENKPTTSKAVAQVEEPADSTDSKPSTSKNSEKSASKDSEKTTSGKTPEIMFGTYLNTFTDEIPATSEYHIKGEYRSGEFVIQNADLKKKRTPIWKIEGKSLLQKFEPFVDFQHRRILYKNASSYSALPPNLTDLYKAVDVVVFSNNRTKHIVQLKNKRETLADYRVDLNPNDNNRPSKPEIKSTPSNASTSAAPARPSTAAVSSHASTPSVPVSQPKKDEKASVDEILSEHENLLRMREETLKLKEAMLNEQMKLLDKHAKLLNRKQNPDSTENSESESEDEEDDKKKIAHAPLKDHFKVLIQAFISQAMDKNFISIIDSEKGDDFDYFNKSFNAIDKVCEDKKKMCSELRRWSVLVQQVAELFPTISSSIKNGKQCCQMCQDSNINNVVIFSGLGYSKSVTDDCFMSQENLKKEYLFCKECTAVVQTFSNLQHYKDKIFQDCKKRVLEVKGDDEMSEAILQKCLEDSKFIKKEFKYLQHLWAMCDQYREVSLKSD